jgi:ABC-type transport system involved in Fe-S cluster assembly fused permease/ATPase subunit
MTAPPKIAVQIQNVVFGYNKNEKILNEFSAQINEGMYRKIFSYQ